MDININILDNLQRKIKQLQDIINVSIQESINNNKNVIKELQTLEQMYQGKNSKGIDIKPAYADSTIKIKRKKSQPTNRVTLNDKGEFYNSIEVIAEKNQMIIRTVLSYSIYLINKYQDILGLDKVSLKKFFNTYTLPIIKNNFNDIITKP